MMCSIGLATGACLGEPIEQSASLSDLSSTRIVYHRAVEHFVIWFEYGWDEQGCAVLGDDFEGFINEVPMQVVHRGSAMDDDGEECKVPSLLFKGDPPAASNTVITLRDRSRAVTCDVGDAFAPRTIQLLPDGPWEFAPGQEVALQWFPATDLERHPMVRVNDQGRELSIGKNIATFTMPENPTTPGGDITFWADVPSCPGGYRIGGWPMFVTQPFTYRTGSALPAEARTDAASAP
jgi:hypothetical protein